MGRVIQETANWTAAVLAASAGLGFALAWAEPVHASRGHRCAGFVGARLARGPRVDVFERKGPRTGTVYACVPPDGRVWTAGTAHDAFGNGVYTVTVIATAGTWVALDFLSSIDASTAEDTEKVVDARTGRSYRFFSSGYSTGATEERNPETVYAVYRALLNGSGQLAMSLDVGTSTRIIGFEPNGASRVLDSGPSSEVLSQSLKLAGRVVEWVAGASIHTATL
jgi:hypothetical protein